MAIGARPREAAASPMDLVYWVSGLDVEIASTFSSTSPAARSEARAGALAAAVLLAVVRHAAHHHAAPNHRRDGCGEVDEDREADEFCSTKPDEVFAKMILAPVMRFHGGGHGSRCPAERSLDA